MYDYFKGTLTFIHPEFLTLEVQGVGYKVLIPPAQQNIPPIDSPLTLYIHTTLREPDLILFGFLSRHERDLFETLIGISGVGPKTALNIIGHLPLPSLQTAILTKNIDTLSKVPGIGKKTAERLLLELKNKFEDLPPMQDPKPHSLFQDAMNALTNLGYSHTSSQKAIADTLKALPHTTTLSTLISTSLKVIK